MENCTTGHIGPRLLALASATGTLSPRKVELLGGALRELAEMNAKEKAFQTVCRAVDPAGRLSLTGLSIRLAQEYRDFKSRGYRRIAAGHRPVANDLEAAWVVLCECECPGSPKRIRDKLKEFVNGTERCPK